MRWDHLSARKLDSLGKKIATLNVYGIPSCAWAVARDSSISDFPLDLLSLLSLMLLALSKEATRKRKIYFKANFPPLNSMFGDKSIFF